MTPGRLSHLTKGRVARWLFHPIGSLWWRLLTAWWSSPLRPPLSPPCLACPLALARGLRAIPCRLPVSFSFLFCRLAALRTSMLSQVTALLLCCRYLLRVWKEVVAVGFECLRVVGRFGLGVWVYEWITWNVFISWVSFQAISLCPCLEKECWNRRVMRKAPGEVAIRVGFVASPTLCFGMYHPPL